MALAALPYKFNITSKAIQTGDTDVTVTFNILDGSGATIVTGATLRVSPNIAVDDFFNAMRLAVLNQMITDAGSKAAFFTAIVGKSVPINQ